MEREWDRFQEKVTELEQQRDLSNKTTNTTWRGADLSYLFSELIEHPYIVAGRGNDTFAPTCYHLHQLVTTPGNNVRMFNQLTEQI